MASETIRNVLIENGQRSLDQILIVDVPATAQANRRKQMKTPSNFAVAIAREWYGTMHPHFDRFCFFIDDHLIKLQKMNEPVEEEAKNE